MRLCDNCADCDDSSNHTYTLIEAKREIQRQECVRFGHSFNVLSSMAGPIKLVCPCGASYRVETT